VTFVGLFTWERDVQKRPTYAEETSAYSPQWLLSVSCTYSGVFCRSLSHVEETTKDTHVCGRGEWMRHLAAFHIRGSLLSVSFTYCGLFCRSLLHVKETTKDTASSHVCGRNECILTTVTFVGLFYKWKRPTKETHICGRGECILTAVTFVGLFHIFRSLL